MRIRPKSPSRSQPQPTPPAANKKRCPTPLSAGYVLPRLFPIVNRHNQQKMLENPDPTISYPTGKLSCKFNTVQCQLCQVALPTFRGNFIKTNAHMREDREVIAGYPGRTKPVPDAAFRDFRPQFRPDRAVSTGLPSTFPARESGPVQPFILTLTALRPPLAYPQIPTCAPDCRSCALRDGTGGRSRRPRRSAPSRPRAVPRYGHCGRPAA
jgi:hypothetical protein